MSYLYLATPYSHPEKAVREHRVKLAAVASRNLLLAGTHVFSPIVHGHFIEVVGGGLVPYEKWMEHSFTMLRKAHTCGVLMLPGWIDSRGVAMERDFAKAHGIPVSMLDPEIWCLVGE